MTPLENRLASALSRIASRTSSVRVRSEDATRASRNGQRNEQEALVLKLEHIADELAEALDTAKGGSLKRVA